MLVVVARMPPEHSTFSALKGIKLAMQLQLPGTDVD